MEGLGGLAAPLLAGFAITMIALVVQVESAPRAPAWALLLLGAVKDSKPTLMVGGGPRVTLQHQHAGTGLAD